MRNDEEDASAAKGSEILNELRGETRSKKHLDQQKIRAEAALRPAIEARDEQALLTALAAPGIDPESEVGRSHLRGFRQLGPRR